MTSFALSAVAPLTVSAGVVPTAIATTGLVGLAVMFPAVAAVLAVFAVGYVAMVQRIPNGGAFYALITHGLGREAGVAAAFTAWFGYSCFAIPLLGAIGAGTGRLTQQWAGISAPWWVWALAAAALAGVLGLLRLKSVTTVLGVLLIAECLVTLIYAVVFLVHPAEGQGSAALATLSPAKLIAPGMGAAIAIAVLSYVGFENPAAYSENVRDPRSVWRAIVVSLFTAAGIYLLVAFALVVTVGPDKIVAVSAESGVDTVFSLAALHVPTFLVDAGLLLLITSMFAAHVSFRSICDRYQFSMAREGVMPAAFARVSTRTGAPVTASLTTTALGVAVIALCALTRADPELTLFYRGVGLGGFVILTLLLGTSIAIPAYFSRHPDQAAQVTRWQATTAPCLALFGLGYMTVEVLGNFDVVVVVPGDSPLRWILPATVLIPIVLGALWARILRARRPAVYQAIGLGADAVTARTPTDPTKETV
ncbi:APC family permease [Cryptosporangium phraense]|uniref:APC family permease n=1 Tax=Cryptosporangium phraense TaxID=2593070 RepID=UPI00147970A4|nr:APC family permease [Cryptosporangium phraense]